jgi:predicted P-loop ATPase
MKSKYTYVDRVRHGNISTMKANKLMYVSQASRVLRNGSKNPFILKAEAGPQKSSSVAWPELSGVSY